METRTILLVSGLLLVVVGCASNLNIERLSEDKIDTTNKDIIFLTSTRWDSQVRRALARYGFTLKKYASIRQIEAKTSDAITETHNEAEARYGISIYPGSIVDWCLVTPGQKFDLFTLEITDLRTNEVILVVEKGGWTHDCPLTTSGKLFPDLAKALSDEWH